MITKILRIYLILNLFWITAPILLPAGELLSSFYLPKAFGRVWDDSQIEKDKIELSRSEINSIIETEAKRFDLQPDLIKAMVKVESNYDISALSPKGAMGLMQLMPKTADDMGVENPWDPAENIKGGVKYFSKLMKEFKDMENALIAYNAGPEIIRKGRGVPLESIGYARRISSILDRAEAYVSFSFSRQAQEAMKLYLENKTLPLLDSLNNLQENFEKFDQKSLTVRLNEGGKLENKGLVSVLDLMSLQMMHNDRMDTWAGEEKKRRNYFAGFRLGKRLIERLRRQYFPRDWPYVACHWHPFGVWSGLKKQEIPNLIGLNNLEFDDPLFHRYTFFGFLRKMTARQRYIQAAYLPLARRYQALGMNPSEEKFDAFLNTQTGFATKPPLWNSNEVVASLGRWKYEDYYMYRYVDHNRLPTENLPLAEAVLRQSIFSRRRDQNIDLGKFYQEKIDFFRDVVAEIEAARNQNREIQPYLPLYSFVARTFPYISAFKLTKDSSARWCFIDGYEGDRPAQRIFGEDSLMRLCNTLLHDLNRANPDQDLIDKILGPIFLLQQRDLDQDAIRFERQFVDVKVGFKGFLDYYKHLKNENY